MPSGPTRSCARSAEPPEDDRGDVVVGLILVPDLAAVVVVLELAVDGLVALVDVPAVVVLVVASIRVVLVAMLEGFRPPTESTEALGLLIGIAAGCDP